MYFKYYLLKIGKKRTAQITLAGKLFHRRGAATLKLRSSDVRYVETNAQSAYEIDIDRLGAFLVAVGYLLEVYYI